MYMYMYIYIYIYIYTRQLKTKQIPALTKFREEFLKDASVKH